MGYPRCNIIDSFSLFYGLLSGLGLLVRMSCSLSFTLAVINRLYYTGDEPYLNKCKYLKHIFRTADERSNRRKILEITNQLKQLRKESLKKIQA